jgi:ACGX-repeat protein
MAYSHSDWQNGSSCGAGDKAEEKPTACGAGDKSAEKPSACGSACGAGGEK